MGGENAGALSAILYLREGDRARSVILAGFGEVIALRELDGARLGRRVHCRRRAAALTAQLELEAYATVVPGTTKDSDLARFLKRRMRELGVEDGWSPAQNPSVNSGADRISALR